MGSVLALLAALPPLGAAAFDLPEPVRAEAAELAGQLWRFDPVVSATAAPRRADVWLPDDLAPGERCAVLVAHDGQNLFLPAESFIGVDWGLDEALAAGRAAGELPPTLVVAVWNTPQRWPEYFPQALWERIPERRRGEARRRGLADEPLSAGYLAFLADELLPAVERRFPVRRAAGARFLLGSSMGGLVSLAALCERPGTWGGAACLSTHWPAGAGSEAAWLRECLPAPGAHRVWMDRGDRTADEAYAALQPAVDAAFLERGWRPGLDWVSGH